MSYTEGVGLLRKAARLRENRPSTKVEVDGYAWSSGLDDKERREIVERIDVLTKRSRLSAEPDIFKVTPRRSGIMLPIVINLLMIAAVAGAVVLVAHIFRGQAAATAQNGVALQSAEGKLLEALKKESSSQLEAKDQAIADIQGRMTALDKERNSLSASIDERVKAKENELRAQLQSQLDAETRRLQAQGISSAAVQAQLKKYEMEKTADFQNRLLDFQKEADAERRQNDARYAQLKSDYEDNLASLAAERQKIQADAQKREEDLRASLEAKSKSMAAENAQALTGLAAAQAELARLDAQKQQAGKAEDRIVSFYAGVRQALDDKRYGDAAVQAAALRSYLDAPEVLALPDLAARRGADVFASESLANYAKLQLDRSSADSTRLLQQAQLLQAAQVAANEGKRLSAAGDAAGAEAKYNEALSLVPDILSAHQYFLSKAQDAEAARRAGLMDALAKAQAAYRAGDFETLTSSYEVALAYLPLSADDRRAIMARLEEAGAASASAARRLADSKAARLAMDEISRAAAEQADASAKAAAALQSKVDDLVSRLAAQTTSAAQQLKAARTEDAAALESLRKAKEDEIAALQDELNKAQGQAQILAAQAAQSPATKPPAVGAAKSLADLDAENKRLKDAADRYDAIKSAYTRFSEAESGLLADGGPGALAEAYGNLVDFLSRPELKDAMPGFDVNVQRNWQAFLNSSMENAVRDQVDICLRIMNIAQLKDADAQGRELRILEKEYDRQAPQLALVKGLEASLHLNGASP
jgi:hypothetical protein